MDQKFISKIDAFIENNKENMFKDMARVIAVNSVRGEAEEGAPYGKGPRKALEVALTIAEELGLKTRNCEDILGYAALDGEEEGYLATITHLDVVPAGEGWNSDPFTLTRRDGHLIGRGILDDKGPALICLYAMKFLKEEGMKLRYPIRALLGTDEEKGMSDVKYYLKNYPAPLFCLSPDASFPLINGEKGSFHAEFVSKPIRKGNILKFEGGTASNVIPGKFEAWIAGDAAKELPCTERVDVEKDGDSWHLTAHGISGHASSPAGKINALGVLIDYILDQKLASPEEETYLKIAVLPHHAYDGSLLGIAASDDCFTPLTVVSGLMFFRDGSIVESLDSRYPTSTNVEKLGEQLKKIAGDDVLVEHIHGSVPFYTAPESPVISACLEAYRFVTGDERKPYTIGGGTYARCFPRGAAFGPVHPDLEAHPELGAIHSANEGASEEGLLQTLKVYILALAALEKLDF